ncbi:MAG: hypothetical protein NVS4B8_24110 [Herpetosiphon sp.]
MGGLLGSSVLELVIGIIFLYWLLSAVCSHINEFLAGLNKWRAKDLERGIQNLLCDTDLTEAVLGKQLIKALGSSGAENKLVQYFAGASPPPAKTSKAAADDYAGKPSYIPASTFTLALFDALAPTAHGAITVDRLRTKAHEMANSNSPGARAFAESFLILINNSQDPTKVPITIDDIKHLARQQIGDGVAPSGAGRAQDADLLSKLLADDPQPGDLIPPPLPPHAPALDAIERATSFDQIRKTILLMPTGEVRDTLIRALDAGQSDLTAVRSSVEGWYESAMDRVSGVYKRRIQVYLLLIALIVTCVTGADTIRITKSLFNDTALRGVLVAEAGRVTSAGNTTAPQAPPEPGGRPNQVAPAAGTPASDPRAVPDLRVVAQELNAVHTIFGYGDAPGRVSKLWSRTWWRSGRWQTSDWWGKWLAWLLAKVFGLLLTAIAVSFGAPFWFDLLQKLTNQRGAGTPPEPISRDGNSLGNGASMNDKKR